MDFQSRFSRNGYFTDTSVCDVADELSWWNVMMIRWCHDNDVMIAATLHWLLLAMWHANHLINSHVIGKSENEYLPKKHKTHFYEWNGAFWTFGQIWVMSFRYPRWNPCTPSLHLMSPFGKYRHQLFTFRFMNPHDYNFLPELSKNVLSRRFQHVLRKGRSGNWNQGSCCRPFVLGILLQTTFSRYFLMREIRENKTTANISAFTVRHYTWTVMV